MNLLNLLLLCALPMMIVEGEGGAPAEGAEGAEGADGKGEQKPDAGEVKAEGKDDKPVKDARPVEEVMLEGIKKAVTPEDPEAKKAADKKKTDEAAAAAAAEENKGKTPEQIAEAKAKKDGDEKKAAEKKVVDKLPAELSDDEKKTWKQETQRRFNELRGYAKSNADEVRRLAEENTALSGARTAMMEAFKEAHVTTDDMADLLDYNRKVKTGDFAGALKIVNDARTAILKAMGREEPGVDLLDDFPDLKEKVANLDMERPAALEVAKARRQQAQMERDQQQRQQQEDQANAGTRAQETALASIEKWQKDVAANDIDYKAKEEIVLAKIGEIIEKYPPDKWLETIRLAYGMVRVEKATPIPNGGDGALRPSGAKPGAKVFTELTPDALRAGLGYPTH